MDFPGIWALGHRGAPLEFIENTAESLVEAIDQGADGVELDVRLTSDSEAVVWHDAWVVNEAGARVEIASATLAELQQIDLGPGTGRPDAAGSRRMIALAEALEVTGEALVDIEIKDLPGEPGAQRNPQLCAAAVDAVGASGARERVIFTSFWLDALETVRVREPGARTGWLLLPGAAPGDSLALAATRGCNAVLPHSSGLADKAGDQIERIRHEGLATIAWTVDDPAEMQRLIAAGVDGIITNLPGLLAEILGRRPPRPPAK